MAMTKAQARGAHCTNGGTIASGKAVCQCGLWRAADASTPADRKASRKAHLDEVLAIRLSETTDGTDWP